MTFRIFNYKSPQKMVCGAITICVQSIFCGYWTCLNGNEIGLQNRSNLVWNFKRLWDQYHNLITHTYLNKGSIFSLPDLSQWPPFHWWHSHLPLRRVGRVHPSFSFICNHLHIYYCTFNTWVHKNGWMSPLIHRYWARKMVII